MKKYLFQGGNDRSGLAIRTGHPIQILLLLEMELMN